MIVLKRTKDLLRTFRLVKGDPNEDLNNSSNVLHYVGFSIIWLSAIVFGLFYLFENFTNVGKATDCICSNSAFVIVLSYFWFLIANRKELNRMLKNLQKVVDEKMGPDTIELYGNADKWTSFFEKFNIPFMIYSGQACVLFRYFTALYGYVRGQTEFDDSFLASKVKLPINSQQTFQVYSAIMTHQLVAYLYGSTFVSTFASLFFGVCMYILAFFANLSCVTNELDDFWRRAHIHPLNSAARIQMKHRLKSLIIFHCQIFDLTRDFAQCFSGGLFMVTMVGILALCCSMFQLAGSSTGPDSSALQGIIIAAGILVMHFVTCFFGQLLTNDLMQVGDIVYHMSWYEYPNDVNRFVRIIMTFSRQPIYFKGLKITVCSLASFGSMLKTAYSVFMVFKSVS